MSKKFEKIELITCMETYLEDPSKSNVSALDFIIEELEKDMEITVVSFKNPIDLKLVETKKKAGK